jgi:hypothetical protein
LDRAVVADREGIFGGIRYAGYDGLSPDEQQEYRRALAPYVRGQRLNPAYSRTESSARQAIAVERDLRRLIHGKLLDLTPKPELVERVQNVVFVAGRFTSAEGVLDLAVNRLVSRAITGALEATPAAAPLAVAVLVAKDVLGVLNEMSLSEREKREEVEDEHRHDREWQFAQVNQHEYERER